MPDSLHDERLNTETEYQRLSRAYNELASKMLGTYSEKYDGYELVRNDYLEGPTDNYIVPSTNVENLDSDAIFNQLQTLNRSVSIALPYDDEQPSQIDQAVVFLRDRLNESPDIFAETWLQGGEILPPHVTDELINRAVRNGYHLCIESNRPEVIDGINYSPGIPNYKGGFVDAFGEDYPLPDSEVYAQKTVESLKNGQLSTFIIGFEKDGQLASCATLTVFNSEEDRQTYACFHGDATEESHRGSGLQKSTIAVRQKILEQLGVDPANWIVFVEQDGNSHRNYQKAGFQEVGTTVYVHETEK